ncbi:MAG: efflux RND transporter periplasmic adaptor subunit [Planctomycetota bacterium]|nr:efflux RND transporter periplasmic adaptor subunit [Planctomycetota bacterium]
MNWKWLANGVVIVAAMGLGVATGWLCLPRQQAERTETKEEETKGAATVQAVPLERGTIEETLTAYGPVEAAIGEAQTFSVPFECRVLRVLVAGGQVIKAGEPLVEIEPSPDSRLLLSQARQELEAARRIADVVGQRVTMKLATQQDLLTAEQAVGAAQLKVDSLEKRGIDGKKTLLAQGEGVVNKIAVGQGAIVPAGGALLETIGEKQIQVRLGVEPGDVGRLRAGQKARLLPVNGPDDRAGEGTVRMVSREVDPATRLVNVFVAPAPSLLLRINEFVQGEVAVAAKEALIVPREAMLVDDGENVLYTIESGHAVRHVVTLGVQNARQVEVIGKDLAPGQTVITVGASQVEDKMPVELAPGAATRPESAPASQPESAR